MEKWERALRKFLEPWRGRKDVLAALATGSRVQRTATPLSDVDVHIILSDRVRWKEQGLKRVDGFLIDYMANPVQHLKRNFVQEYKNGARGQARMFVVGQVVFDKTGILGKLRLHARKELRRPFKKQARSSLDWGKYAVWETLDSLRDLKTQDSPGFWFLYHLHLRWLLNIYARFLRVEEPAPVRVHRFLTESEFRKKYRIGPFPDEKFVQLMRSALEKPAFARIESLTSRVLGKMGGFDADDWKMRTPVPKLGAK